MFVPSSAKWWRNMTLINCWKVGSLKGFPDVWVNSTPLILKPAERLAGREVRDLSGVAGSFNLIVRINVGQVSTENVFVLQLYICLGWYFYFCSCSVRVRKTRVSVRGKWSNFRRKNTRFCVTETAGSVSRRPSKISSAVTRSCHPYNVSETWNPEGRAGGSLERRKCHEWIFSYLFKHLNFD